MIVRALGAAGAVMAGKTHLFEFAWGLTGENAHFGDCEHPRFPGRTTGGSSSGSALAVAADIVPFAVGTDTGGSIRVPAAFCGIFGYRGTPGDAWISDAVPLSPRFDTAGWFTQSAADMRSVLDALIGPPVAGKTPRGCYLDMPDLEPQVAEACRAAAADLAQPAGGLPATSSFRNSPPRQRFTAFWRGPRPGRSTGNGPKSARARYGPLLQDRLERARGISPAQVAAVEPSFEALLAVWKKFFLAHDFLVIAASPFPASRKADCTPANRLRLLDLTTPASLAGLPVLTIPVPLPSGLSTGLQVIPSHPRSPVLPWILEGIASRKAAS